MEHDHMIEAFASNRTNHSLYMGSLPRRTWCRQDLANAHVSHFFSEIIAKDPIAIPQQGSFVRERLRKHYSSTGRPSIDPEVLLRLLLIGYLYGITSERRLLEEVRMHLACRCALPSRSVGCETNAGTYGPVWNSATEPCSGQGLWKRRVSGVAVGTRYPTAYSSYRSAAPNTGALHRRAVSL